MDDFPQVVRLPVGVRNTAYTGKPNRRFEWQPVGDEPPAGGVLDLMALGGVVETLEIRKFGRSGRKDSVFVAGPYCFGLVIAWRPRGASTEMMEKVEALVWGAEAKREMDEVKAGQWRVTPRGDRALIDAVRPGRVWYRLMRTDSDGEPYALGVETETLEVVATWRVEVGP